MDLKKIAIQLFKADKARKALNKNQLIELTACIDKIHNFKSNAVYVKYDLTEIEAVLLNNYENLSNDELLTFFVNLGQRQYIYTCNAQNLLIKIYLNRQPNNYACFELLELNKSYTNCNLLGIDDLYKSLIKFDFFNGIEVANIPQWILDIPVTADDSDYFNNVLANYCYIKNNDALYSLNKEKRGGKTVYIYSKYDKNHCETSDVFNSCTGGLKSTMLHNLIFKRCATVQDTLKNLIETYDR